MNGRPMRPTEEIARLQDRCLRLEERLTEVMSEVRPVLALLPQLMESIEEYSNQVHAILECGDKPAPIFLRWNITTDDEDSRVRWARAAFGKYRLEVCDGRSAVSWAILKGASVVDAGGGCHHFETGMDEAEEALRRIVQSGAPVAKP